MKDAVRRGGCPVGVGPDLPGEQPGTAVAAGTAAAVGTGGDPRTFQRHKDAFPGGSCGGHGPAAGMDGQRIALPRGGRVGGSVYFTRHLLAVVLRPYPAGGQAVMQGIVHGLRPAKVIGGFGGVGLRQDVLRREIAVLILRPGVLRQRKPYPHPVTSPGQGGEFLPEQHGGRVIPPAEQADLPVGITIDDAAHHRAQRGHAHAAADPDDLPGRFGGDAEFPQRVRSKNGRSHGAVLPQPAGGKASPHMDEQVIVPALLGLPRGGSDGVGAAGGGAVDLIVKADVLAGQEGGKLPLGGGKAVTQDIGCGGCDIRDAQQLFSVIHTVPPTAQTPPAP